MIPVHVAVTLVAIVIGGAVLAFIALGLVDLYGLDVPADLRPLVRVARAKRKHSRRTLKRLAARG